MALPLACPLAYGERDAGPVRYDMEEMHMPDGEPVLKNSGLGAKLLFKH